MPELTTTFSELVSSNLIEIGAGRPRTVNINGRNLPILRVADVLDGRIESTHKPHSSAEDVSGGDDSKVSRPGDIVLTTKGTVGRVALMPHDGPSFAYSPQLCFFRTAVNGPLRSRFLYYWFKSAAFWVQANALKGQTDMADFLSLGDLQRMRVKVPSLDRQDAVADILGALDDKIAVNNGIARNSNILGQAIFASMATSGRKTLNDACAIVMGQSPPGETYNENGDGIPFYQGTRDFGFYYPGRRVWCTAVTRHASAGDILVSVRAPVGDVNVALDACGIGRGLAALRAYTSPHVLRHALILDSAAWSPFEGEGTVFSSINKQQLHVLTLMWPAPEEEARLEPVLRVLDQRITAALKENESLSELRDMLLPELMSGRLRVKDADKVVEKAI